MIKTKDIVKFVKENGEYQKELFLLNIYKHAYAYVIHEYTIYYEEVDKVFSGALKLYKNGVLVNNSNIINGVSCTDTKLDKVFNKCNNIFEVIDLYYEEHIKEIEKEDRKNRLLNKYMGKEV